VPVAVADALAQPIAFTESFTVTQPIAVADSDSRGSEADGHAAARGRCARGGAITFCEPRRAGRGDAHTKPDPRGLAVASSGPARDRRNDPDH